MNSAETQRRIAVTGLGIFSPIGIGGEDFKASLLAERSGIAPTQLYENTATPGGIGGEIPDFTEATARKSYLKGQRKSLKVMSRETQLGVAAAIMAVEDSGLNLEEIDHERFGVEYGANLMFFSPDTMSDSCGACRNSTGEFEFSKWGDNGLGAMEPLWMLRYLPNMPACHIAISTDARGPNNSVTLDEASPGVALTEALNIMQRGAADLMLVGGTGTRLHPVRAIHARLYDELGFDESNPAGSCKPFDRERNGQVVAEAAACFLLEEESHARARGARIFGYLLGGGSSCVAVNENPDIEQAVLNASRAALRRAGISAAELGHVNAHGLATTEADRLEASALRQLLGENALEVPVSAQKGFFGNSGAASGFLEIAASLLALQENRIPTTLHCQHPDPELGLKVAVSGAPAPVNKRFLNINFTRAGQASATVFEGA